MKTLRSKILIVDDNAFYLSVLKTILKDVEVDVYMANSGEEAIKLVEENNFALAVLDIEMPGMDGFEVAGRIRNMPQRDLLPIIFLTAYFSDEIQMFKGYDNGAIDYLTKPVNKDMFISKVKIFLELDRQKRVLQANKESLLQSKMELEQNQREIRLQNITLQKTLTALEKSESLYHSLLKTSPDGILLIDLDGKIIEASDIAISLLDGKMKGNFEGILVTQFFPGRLKIPLIKLLLATRKLGRVQNTEVKLCRTDHTEFTGEVSTSQIKDGSGNVNAYMAVIRDISERKLIEKQLRHSEKMAGIGELATGMAHEINQPLNTMSMAIDNILFALESNTITENYLKTKIDKVFDNITRIKKIIDHVRTFSRDQDDFGQSKFDIDTSISNSISMISEQLEHLGIELSYKKNKQIPEIRGNTYRFEQVMLNLLVNAKDAIEEKYRNEVDSLVKKIDICTELIDNQVVLKVKDNGIGIDQKNIEKVLMPFFTTKVPGQGTGLGLSISYGIIKELGGDIDIQSIPNEGTTVQITIPVQEIKSKKTV